MGFFSHLLHKNILDKNNAFIWNSQKKNFKSIDKINALDLNLIVGVERQKKTILCIILGKNNKFRTGK